MNRLEQLKHKLIVSCQAEGDSPFNSPEAIFLFAKAAVMGGAGGIRSEGIEKTAYIKNNLSVPVIGLIKSSFNDGSVRITGSFKDVESLLKIDTDIIAIDGTFRERENLTGPEFIEEVKKRYGCIVMADISTIDEAIACEAAGADIISTTLSGYTPETKNSSSEPDYELVERLTKVLKVPVVAEGRISSPAQAAEMIKRGAFTVVVGSAITRPIIITSQYVEAVENCH
jgi:N-acylglucosamine-6-phosphate 2-epimerase